MNETFRPRNNFIWAGSSLVLLILFVANSFLMVEKATQRIFETIFAMLLGATVYLIWIKPKMVLRNDFIEVVNPFRRELIEYGDVINLETKWVLTIIHKRGRTKVWVAPASGKQRWVADKKFGWYGNGLPFSESRGTEMESMSDSLNSVSGQAAYMIRERIKRRH
jgi:hypothetical protein